MKITTIYTERLTITTDDDGARYRWNDGSFYRITEEASA